MTTDVAGAEREGPIERGRRVYGVPRPFGIAIVLAPWLLLIGFGLLLRFPATHAQAVVLLSENQVVEMMTFAAFFTGGLIGVGVAMRAGRWGLRPLVGRLYALLGIGLLVLGMEEISWGQWLFHFKTPHAIEALNQQHETNLHNLAGIQAFDLWIIIAIGLVGLWGIRAYRNPRFRPISVPSMLASYFVAIVVGTGLDLLTFHVSIEPHFDDILTWLAEVVELVLALSGLLLVGLNLRMLRPRGRRDGSSG